MKLAIHYNKHDFSTRWVEYCKQNGVDYKIVSCYDDDIISQLHDCDGLLWHYHHASPKDMLFAKQLMFALQSVGKAVFPDFHTAWHFDDKVAQKYLMEALDLPLVPSYVFYDKVAALQWVDETDFPKVFKLRRGAGSAHVQLTESRSQARKLVSKAFGAGFPQYNKLANLKERWYKYRNGKTNIKDVVKGVLRLIKTTEFARVAGNEAGYVYFQDFIPDNDHDIRVIVIGNRAFAIKRMVRENDFRASGSAKKYMNKSLFDPALIALSFDIAEKLKSQSVAFDFINDNGVPKIVEISFGFIIDEVPGYWDRDLQWHDEKISPQHWMVENLLASVSEPNKALHLECDLK